MGGPDPGESFPPRYTASHLGKVTLERRRYLSLEEEMTNGPEVVWAASPRAWASRRLDVWAVHSRGWRRPRLMRVWFNRERALVEIHTNRSVKVDEILPSEIVGFVRGYTRLGPRTGVVDGLRWLPEDAMLMGHRPLTRTFRTLTDLSVVSPVGSPVGDALRAGDFHALTFSCSCESAGWDSVDSELRVLDVAGSDRTRLATRSGVVRPTRRRRLRWETAGTRPGLCPLGRSPRVGLRMMAAAVSSRRTWLLCRWIRRLSCGRCVRWLSCRVWGKRLRVGDGPARECAESWRMVVGGSPSDCHVPGMDGGRGLGVVCSDSSDRGVRECERNW